MNDTLSPGKHGIRADPAFLEELRPFHAIDIGAHDGSVYGLWADMSLALVNEAWFRFARENGGEPAISQRWPLGTCLTKAIPQALRPFYDRLFGAVLNGPTTPRPIQHEYECSSADVYRKFQMSLYPLASRRGVLVVNSLIVEASHDASRRVPHPPHEEVYRCEDGLIRQCAHCRRTQSPADPTRWDWVPAFIATMPPHINHTLCTFCHDLYWGPDGAWGSA